jgi:hypothetical protein
MDPVALDASNPSQRVYDASQRRRGSGHWTEAIQTPKIMS